MSRLYLERFTECDHRCRNVPAFERGLAPDERTGNHVIRRGYERTTLGAGERELRRVAVEIRHAYDGVRERKTMSSLL
jgi:hypothetical protein